MAARSLETSFELQRISGMLVTNKLREFPFSSNAHSSVVLHKLVGEELKALRKSAEVISFALSNNTLVRFEQLSIVSEKYNYKNPPRMQSAKLN